MDGSYCTSITGEVSKLDRVALLHCGGEDTQQDQGCAHRQIRNAL